MIDVGIDCLAMLLLTAVVVSRISVTLDDYRLKSYLELNYNSGKVIQAKSYSNYANFSCCFYFTGKVNAIRLTSANTESKPN